MKIHIEGDAHHFDAIDLHTAAYRVRNSRERMASALTQARKAAEAYAAANERSEKSKARARARHLPARERNAIMQPHDPRRDADGRIPSNPPGSRKLATLRASDKRRIDEQARIARERQARDKRRAAAAGDSAFVEAP